VSLTITTSGRCASGVKIASLNGLYAFPFINNGAVKVAIWGTRPLTTPALAMPTLSAPSCELTTDRIVVCSAADDGVGQVLLREFSIDNPSVVLSEYKFGGNGTNPGASCRLRSGKIVFVNYQHNKLNEPTDSRFHITSKFGATWLTQQFNFPFAASMPSIFCAMVEGTDGLIWLFWTRDSWGGIGCARFRINGAMLELISEPFGITPNGSNLGISGEIPRISAITDWVGKRIILGYQSAAQTYVGPLQPGEPPRPVCPDSRWLSNSTVISEVLPDKRQNLIALLPYFSSHVRTPIAGAWPRPDGIYWIADYVLVPSCEKGWKTGIAVAGKVTGSMVDGTLLAVSDDGWYAFQRPSPLGGPVELIQTGFVSTPTLTITPCDTATIRWTPVSPTDQLQFTTDLNSAVWTDIPGATAPPWVVQTTGPHKFYRIKPV